MFFKKKRNPMTDKNFLCLTFDDSMNQKNHLLQECIELVEENSFTNFPPISETLPYLNFLDAEMLLNTVKEKVVFGQGKQVRFKQLAIAHNNKKGRAETKGEISLENFVLQEDYTNLMHYFAQEMFTSKKYEEYPFESKVQYFTGDLENENSEAQSGLFDVYMEVALQPAGLGYNHLPKLPEVASEVENFEFLIPALVEETPKFEPPPPILQPIVESVVKEVETAPIPQFQPTPEAIQVKPKKEQVFKKKEYIQPKTTLSENLFAFQKFMVDVFEPDVPAYETQYVVSKLNEWKQKFNEEIRQKEQVNTQASEHFIEKQVQEFETEELLKIENWLKTADNRNSIKSEVLSRKRMEQGERLQNMKNILSKEKAQLLAEALRKYEAECAEIEQSFTQKDQASTQEIKQQCLLETNETLQQSLLEATTKLEDELNEKYLVLEESMNVKRVFFTQQTTEISERLSRLLYTHYQEVLEDLEEELLQEHERALELHLLEKREQLLQEETRTQQFSLQQIQAELTNIRQNQLQTTQNEQRLKEELHQQTTLHLQEQMQMNQQMGQMILNQQHSGTPISTPASQNRLKVLKGMTAGLLCLGIFGGSYLYKVSSNNQESITAIEKKSTALEQQFDKNLTFQKKAVKENDHLIQSVITQQTKLAQTVSNQTKVIQELVELPIVTGGEPVGQTITGVIK